MRKKTGYHFYPLNVSFSFILLLNKLLKCLQSISFSLYFNAALGTLQNHHHLFDKYSWIYNIIVA